MLKLLQGRANAHSLFQSHWNQLLYSFSLDSFYLKLKLPEPNLKILFTFKIQINSQKQHLIPNKPSSHASTVQGSHSPQNTWREKTHCQNENERKNQLGHGLGTVKDLCMYLLAQTALRAPPEVAFAMRSWPLLSPTFALSLSLFLLLCVLLLTHFGETPHYFGITRRYLQKRIYNL